MTKNNSMVKLKNHLSLLVWVITLIPTGASSGFNEPDTIKSIDNVLSVKDGHNVELTGSIITSIESPNNNLYSFRDKTGRIQIKIEHNIWNGLNVKPSDNIIIFGKVNFDWLDLRIDVDKVEKLPHPE
ncbi:YgiW/YdeI family stress tolerance OB fold protein [Vibrio sp. T20]|uniref:YgiW/YdeI family stress tolerance OB fold protein n=1 Tax=Vibrio sp. T20 TaxID=2588450 RepID=UPI0011B76483|nr:NirD/YgiW/YdeI family stress tolerance protein [Vibrio sp. T20]